MQLDKKRLAAACLLQRVFRGYRARVWLGNNYRRLVLEREDRTYCVECTGSVRSVATRLCRTCRDRYCEACWKRFHAHGNKRAHIYRPLVVEDDMMMPGGQPQSEWVEHWDSSAQATYYYNLRTGEASWTTPEELDGGMTPYNQLSAYNSFLL